MHSGLQAYAALFTILVFSLSGDLYASGSSVTKAGENDASCVDTELPKSDHIIFDCFGDWRVRHVFDSNDLGHRYSDAKTYIQLVDGKTIDVQVNKVSEHSKYGLSGVSIIVEGWWDRVTISSSDGSWRHVGEQQSLHTYSAALNSDDLIAIANTSGDLIVELLSGDKTYSGTISTKGSSAALRWIRVIK